MQPKRTPTARDRALVSAVAWGHVSPDHARARAHRPAAVTAELGALARAEEARRREAAEAALFASLSAALRPCNPSPVSLPPKR